MFMCLALPTRQMSQSGASTGSSAVLPVFGMAM